MKVLIVEPRQRPRRADIPHTLDEMQHIVGGYIQAVYWFSDPVALVCDDEGKLKGAELNRYIAGKDIIAGTFFICGLGAEDFTDLSMTWRRSTRSCSATRRHLRGFPTGFW